MFIPRETFSGAAGATRASCLPLHAIAGLFALLLLSTACGGSSGGSSGGRAVAGGSAVQEDDEQDDSIAVRVHKATREALSSIYATSATLRADKQATVTARTRGVIHRLLVEEGDSVEQGQPLAELENDEQQIEYARASATRDTKLREYERAKELHDQALLSDEDSETIHREAQEAEHAAELSELRLSRTVIRAPFSGKVLKRHLDVGGNVSDGSAVYELADLQPLYADVNVPERQIGRLARGQVVRLIADATGETAEARIERLAPMVDAASGTVKVTLAVVAATHLRPGGFVRVEIVTDTHGDALVVPRSALVAEGRRWHLFRVADDEGRVERLEVLRGFEEGDRVEILETIDAETGLDAGDQVVVVGASALTDGAAVRVIEDDAQTAGEPRRREASRVAA